MSHVVFALVLLTSSSKRDFIWVVLVVVCSYLDGCMFLKPFKVLFDGRGR